MLFLGNPFHIKVTEVSSSRLVITLKASFRYRLPHTTSSTPKSWTISTKLASLLPLTGPSTDLDKTYLISTVISLHECIYTVVFPQHGLTTNIQPRTNPCLATTHISWAIPGLQGTCPCILMVMMAMSFPGWVVRFSMKACQLKSISNMFFLFSFTFIALKVSSQRFTDKKNVSMTQNMANVPICKIGSI